MNKVNTRTGEVEAMEEVEVVSRRCRYCSGVMLLTHTDRSGTRVVRTWKCKTCGKALAEKTAL